MYLSLNLGKFCWLFFQFFLALHSFSFLSWVLMTQMLYLLLFSHRSLRICLFFKIFSPLLFIFNYFYWCLQLHWLFLLLSLFCYRVHPVSFFISVIVVLSFKISFWFFFISSVLLIFSVLIILSRVFAVTQLRIVNCC